MVGANMKRWLITHESGTAAGMPGSAFRFVVVMPITGRKAFSSVMLLL
jgi:hypothetical protein